MKKVVKLTESELRKVISEAVSMCLNEISYTTAKSAYDNMNKRGQNVRASNLNDTFGSINNDNDATYDLSDGSLTLKGDEVQNGNERMRPQTYYNNNSDGTIRSYPETEHRGIGLDGKERFDVVNRPVDPYKRDRITTNPKVAKNMARHMKNFNPQSTMTKDSFRQ